MNVSFRIVPIILQQPGGSLYTLQFEDMEWTEYADFLQNQKVSAQLLEFNSIQTHLLDLVMRKCFRNPFLKFENDVEAFHLHNQKLRIYCARYFESCLILGNGGIKDTPTVQEDKNLERCWHRVIYANKMILQAKQDGLLKINENTGAITGNLQF